MLLALLGNGKIAAPFGLIRDVETSQYRSLTWTGIIPILNLGDGPVCINYVRVIGCWRMPSSPLPFVCAARAR